MDRRTGGQRTKGDQKSSLELSAQVSKKQQQTKQTKIKK
jgi:hypothetical protein